LVRTIIKAGRFARLFCCVAPHRRHIQGILIRRRDIMMLINSEDKGKHAL